MKVNSPLAGMTFLILMKNLFGWNKLVFFSSIVFKFLI